MRGLMKGIPVLLALSVFLLAMGNRPGDDRVFRVRDGKIMSFFDLVQDLRGTRVIFVGENHGSKEDHRFQIRVIQALHGAGVPLAVGLEMFRADSQQELDLWVQGDMELGKFLRVYYDNWGLPWPLYKDIFLYCRDKKIPLIGLNVPGEITKKVAQQGFSSLSSEERKRLPAGISCNIDDRYMDFIRRAYAVHGSGETSFLYFCEAQMVWDKTMAWHLVKFLAANPGRTVIVLAGAGHSRKKGIPGQMENLERLSYRVMLPEVPGRTDRSAAGVHDADYLLLR